MAVHVEYVKLTFSVLALSAKNLLVNIKNIVKQQKNSLHFSFTQDNKYVTDFKKKAELFNLFFAKQCSIIDTLVNFRQVFSKTQTNLSLQLLSLVMILQH